MALWIYRAFIDFVRIWVTLCNERRRLKPWHDLIRSSAKLKVIFFLENQFAMLLNLEKKGEKKVPNFLLLCCVCVCVLFERVFWMLKPH